MRYSKQRELVMQQVEQLHDHPTAEEIYQNALRECPGLSLGTVYRNLNSLVEAASTTPWPGTATSTAPAAAGSRTSSWTARWPAACWTTARPAPATAS